MTGALLQTKLYAPRLRPSLVPRPHLIQRLQQGIHRRLTLISAPAGFGKTTLVTEWIAASERPFAWLSLDERDGDLGRFLTYLCAALQAHLPEAAAHAADRLASPEPPSAEPIVTTLINAIAAGATDLALVLDDYHALDAPAVDDAITFLLDHLPPQLHLVITTREDPPLPLARLRARGWLTELRAADLRFTPEEAAAFLRQATGLDLTPAELTALDARTEGWIAGLQLAALSMQGRADAHSFIDAFAGDHRYVVDYLVEEVLQRQPPAVRRFLLETSILERLSGPLCDAVTDQADSDAMLERLERGNLFVIPLDDRRQWYRYHHLFADVLEAHARKDPAVDVNTLHRRAGRWYQANDQLPDAVRHALAGGDFDRAADLAERAWPALDRSRQAHIWLGWVNRLPPEIVRARPVLGTSLAWALLDSGDLEAAATHLDHVEQQLAGLTPAGPGPAATYVDAAQYQALPATLATARTYLSLALGDLPATQRYARQALAVIPADDHERRGTPAALLGLATLAGGDLAAAFASFTDAMASYQKAGNILFAITGTFILADIRLAQGRLPAAIDIYRRAIETAEAAGGPALRGLADLYLGLADLHREQNDLATADDLLGQSKTLNDQAMLSRWQHRYLVVRSRMQEAAGDLAGARRLLDAAERAFVRGPVPELRPIPALAARAAALAGDLAAAERWARRAGVSVDDEMRYAREFEHLTLARVRILRGRVERDRDALAQAASLLARLLRAAEAGERAGSAIEISIQQALAHDALGAPTAARAALTRALTLAAPAGYARLFVDEGRPLARLLHDLRPEDPDLRSYTSRLLAAFTPEPEPSAAAAPPQPLVEPLSERELEVLRLVAQGLSNRQIAERLFLALSTVKGHNRTIYSKLNVSRRTEAVARARALGLL